MSHLGGQGGPHVTDRDCDVDGVERFPEEGKSCVGYILILFVLGCNDLGTSARVELGEV